MGQQVARSRLCGLWVAILETENERSEKVEHWRKVEAQVLTALCETKKVWRSEERRVGKEC